MPQEAAASATQALSTAATESGPSVSGEFLPGLHKLGHQKQLSTWDCGVACLMMVLSSLNRDHTRDTLLAALGTNSVWTIDLALILHEHGICFHFLTRSTGVSPAYKGIAFYRSQFDADAARVTRRFREARRRNLAVGVGSLEIADIRRLVELDACAVLVLVDARHLPHHFKSAAASAAAVAGSGATAAAPNAGALPPAQASYRGHYVLLLGYADDGEGGDGGGGGVGGAFVARDPAVPEEHVLIAATVLDAARRSFGTDEDMLVIDL
ncbi:Guanylyl cyclase, partial [Tribonema minus]